MSKDEEEDKIAECAAEWLVRLDSIAPEDHAEFFAWVMHSSAHANAFKAALRLRLELVRHQLTSDDAPVEAARARPQWRPLIAAAAAAAIVATSLLVWSWKFEALAQDAIRTDAGEWRRETLADGSVVLAGPRAHLIVEFTNGFRTVQLEDGAALFHVASDAKRPFIVVSALGTARAVGTTFTASVDGPGQFRVEVKEGLVTVARRTDAGEPGQTADAPMPSVTLKAGEQVIVSPHGALAPTEVNIEMTMAWTRRLLIFDNHTVGQAVREFNRLNKVQLRVLDPVLLRHVLSGSFNATDLQSFLAYLATQGEFTVVDDTAGTLLIVPKSGAATMDAGE